MSAAPHTAPRPPVTLLLASPRGFCAGVERAIVIVEEALKRFGAPVYVRHEIVHNRTVVDGLRAKGAIFVEDLRDVPEGAHVIFSAHGVSQAVVAEAGRRKLAALDATCPLVSKVHNEALHHHEAGRTVILIGHAGHPEVEGTMGQLPAGAVILVQNVRDADAVSVPDAERLAYATQTTLSADDTADILAVLQRRFPAIRGPAKADICYATTNRQAAVKAIAPRSDLIIVVGAPNSSNSMRLVEVAKLAGARDAMLVERASQIDWERVKSARTIGITAGASAPEILVEEVIAALRERFDVTIEAVTVTREDTVFSLPKALVS
ncbi:MAG: 4-hydroxy-3-methylbut-2-enyl diphosphate reductase [Gemmatimonas sp.]